MIVVYLVMPRPRAIPKAVDLISGEILTAADLFSTARQSAEARKQYNEDQLKSACLECDQLLIISKSSREKHYFRHFADSEKCLLKEPSLSQKDVQQIASILAAKESDRHKYLKNRIAGLLKQTDDVDRTSICADDKFIFHDGEKRRPDVYCRYRGVRNLYLKFSYLIYHYAIYSTVTTFIEKKAFI